MAPALHENARAGLAESCPSSAYLVSALVPLLRCKAGKISRNDAAKREKKEGRKKKKDQRWLQDAESSLINNQDITCRDTN